MGDYNVETKELKVLEEAELTVTLFEKNNVVATSGTNSGTNSGSCFAPGTKITMADGTFKNVEDVLEGDMVMTYDHELGNVIGREVTATVKLDDEDYTFILSFSDGTKLKLIHVHCFYEQESRKYVYISIDNAREYIGKHFYSVAEKGFVELVNVTFENEKMCRYTIYTKYSINYIANGMLNVSDDVTHLLNLYEFDENLKVDKKALDRDIQQYGIFEYNGQLNTSKEEYENWNCRYLNIAVGKGLITWDEIFRLKFEYVAQLNNKEKSKSA